MNAPHWPQPRAIGLGDATADFESLLTTSVDPEAVKAGFESSLSEAAANNPQYAAAKGTITDAITTYNADANATTAGQGALAAIGGGQPTDQQIEAGFTVVAEAAAVVAGVTIAAAGAVLAPIALLVFGGGEALGALIKNALGITNATPVACSPGDTFKYGDNPSDPNWITFQFYVDHNAPPHGWPEAGQHWQPYTTGSFESWATPIIIRAFELAANCKPIPGVKNWRYFAQGLVAAWNAQFPGAPRKTIGPPPALPDVTYGSANQVQEYRWKNSPIWWLIQGMGVQQYDSADRTKVSAPPLPQDQWKITVADPPNTPRLVHIHFNAANAKAAAPVLSTGLSTPAKVAVGASAVTGAALVGTAIYSYASGKAIDAVLGTAWRAVKGWFK